MSIMNIWKKEASQEKNIPVYLDYTSMKEFLHIWEEQVCYQRN